MEWYIAKSFCRCHKIKLARFNSHAEASRLIHYGAERLSVGGLKIGDYWRDLHGNGVGECLEVRDDGYYNKPCDRSEKFLCQLDLSKF